MFVLFSKKNKDKGYTMIELVLVMAMIIIMLGIFFVNYKSGTQNLALQRAANKLMGDIRRAQTLAGVDLGCGSHNYGINFDRTSSKNTQYNLFSDCNGNKSFNTSDTIEKVEIEKGVKICSITINSSSKSKTDLLFVPPDPFLLVDGTRRDNSASFTSLNIVICLESDDTQTKTISVNRAGMIFIQ